MLFHGVFVFFHSLCIPPMYLGCAPPFFVIFNILLVAYQKKKEEKKDI